MKKQMATLVKQILALYLENKNIVTCELLSRNKNIIFRKGNYILHLKFKNSESYSFIEPIDKLLRIARKENSNKKNLPKHSIQTKFYSDNILFFNKQKGEFNFRKCYVQSFLSLREIINKVKAKEIYYLNS